MAWDREWVLLIRHLSMQALEIVVKLAAMRVRLLSKCMIKNMQVKARLMLRPISHQPVATSH